MLSFDCLRLTFTSCLISEWCSFKLLSQLRSQNINGLPVKLFSVSNGLQIMGDQQLVIVLINPMTLYKRTPVYNWLVWE
ncbi:unnamed protein product [Allacma fusca]|uniref:Uncharacterized protein n=1 Tax=Allacma fusca TaxID=39272 RepID=A0A8J2L4Z6_9HEXA|nr:unnamed protein product [Allacma fusca]